MFYYLEDFINSVKPNTPNTEQYIENDKLVVELSLAGVSREMLSVEENNEELTIRADKWEGARGLAGRGFKTHLVDMKKNWDFKNIDATFTNGILRLVIPPRAEKPPNMVKIK